MSAFLAEIIGTAILVIFGAGVCANVNLKKSFAFESGWIVVALGWGLSVAMGVYAVGQFSGAHLNPAVTLGLAFNGDFPWADVPGYILAQMLGAIIGATVIWLHFLPHWKATEDPGTKLGVFSTGPAIPHHFSNVLSEFIGTFVLVLGLLTIGANEFTEGLKPFIVGLLIVAIGLSLGGTTGYAINPARDLGPRIAHFLLPIAGKASSNWSYAWVPVIGPVFGGSFAGVFYHSVFMGQMTAAFWFVLAATIGMLVICGWMDKKQTHSESNVSV
ncbi:MIP/aquaporin family protein [Aureibacillus halotolerans]|uniref:Glycerol uptake facilitator protein n=1 Tax=Aureibacillus halotolerans TaxID=1508390 RepID=A0A4R6TPD5_9BACI|nr:MIP/aquaporin family protein [Aureibacillus halotolerans]TDQ33726.1 glycerol uptake facilitator protein [Aureibacillus halotolerans]